MSSTYWGGLLCVAILMQYAIGGAQRDAEGLSCRWEVGVRQQFGISDRHSRSDHGSWAIRRGFEHPCSEIDISVSPGMKRHSLVWEVNAVTEQDGGSPSYLPTAPQRYRGPTPQ